MVKEISILITTYNSGKYIQQSIRSMLNQTYRNFELMIIDDGSTDNTEQIVRHFNDQRIKYVKIPHIGRSSVLNYGLSICKHDWVALMDADDICDPNRLEKQIKTMVWEENTVSCTWCSYFINNKILYTVETPVDYEMFLKKIALHSYICNPSVIYNRKFILKNGGYNESLERFEDYDLWLRLRNNIKFIIVPEYLLYMRVVPNSNSRNDFNNTRKEVYILQEKYYDNLEKNFGICEHNEQKILRGWREYFYGDKKEVIQEWKNVSYYAWNYRMVFALLVSLVSQKKFMSFLNCRPRMRFSLIFKRRDLKKYFKSTLQNLEYS